MIVLRVAISYKQKGLPLPGEISIPRSNAIKVTRDVKYLEESFSRDRIFKVVIHSDQLAIIN